MTDKLWWKRCDHLLPALMATALAFSYPTSSGANDPIPNATKAWETIASWRAPMPKVKVLSGHELAIGGIRCRLFGVALPSDAGRAAKAKRFLELYMQTYGHYFSIYNDRDPVTSKDGVPLIWIGGHGAGGWAQETLVEAGLVNVNYGAFENYRFAVPAKTGEKDLDWKKCLRDAVAAQRGGKRPSIIFHWPESN